MFELFRTRSVERDRITDERRIASLMASLDSFLDECITERTGLQARVHEFQANSEPETARKKEYFNVSNNSFDTGKMALSEAEQRLEALDSYINTIMQLKRAFTIELTKCQNTAFDFLNKVRLEKAKV